MADDAVDHVFAFGNSTHVPARAVDRVTAPRLSEHVSFDVEGGVAILELRRPEKRNAITWEMCEAILAHLDAAALREDVRALVVQGAGSAFCAGADLAGVKSPDGTQSASFNEIIVRALKAIADFPVPTLARIQGACVGGGCAVALACDIRFAHPSAFFSIPAVRYGIVYEPTSIAQMVELMGSSQAGRMLYTARRLDASEAERVGLVDVCGDDLDGLVSDFLADVLLGDPATIAATRTLVRQAAGRSAARDD